MKVTLMIYAEEFTRIDHLTVPDNATRKEILTAARERVTHGQNNFPMWVVVFVGDTQIGTVAGVHL